MSLETPVALTRADLAGIPAIHTALLDLNNAHAQELSLLDETHFLGMIDTAFHATRIGNAHALMIAFDQSATYDSPNFDWFKARFDRFVYVDRLVTAPAARGRGLARTLYADLFAAARAAGHARVVCEVNLDPPNPGSDRLHAALGFAEVGIALLPSGKTVRYLERQF